MPQARFEPGSSGANLLEFERPPKPLGHHSRFKITFIFVKNYEVLMAILKIVFENLTEFAAAMHLVSLLFTGYPVL